MNSFQFWKKAQKQRHLWQASKHVLCKKQNHFFQKHAIIINIFTPKIINIENKIIGAWGTRVTWQSRGCNQELHCNSAKTKSVIAGTRL